MMRAAATTMSAAVVLATGVQVLPAVTWIPTVRRWVPALRGQGRPDHIALTFDDGPSRGTTVPLLELLERYRVHATFFVVGQRLQDAPGLGREIVAAGHEIAVHSWSHSILLGEPPRVARDELRRTRDLIHEVTGIAPVWFRPPHGVLTGPAWWAARHEGLRPVLWGSSGWDWLVHTDPRRIARRVAASLSPGATVLLHDAPLGAPQTAGFRMRRALPAILDDCRARGFQIGPLHEHGVPSLVR